MHNWINALADLQRQGEPCVLVTLIEEQGSTPRNAGSKMVISATQTFDTIGGGHLEWQAMAQARAQLAGQAGVLVHSYLKSHAHSYWLCVYPLLTHTVIWLCVINPGFFGRAQRYFAKDLKSFMKPHVHVQPDGILFAHSHCEDQN